MPTYNSLGISATLVVTDLEQTLSDEINMRMGANHQKDAKRIQSRLSNGRTLLEQPVGLRNSKVGVLQFVGEDEDMVLFLVKANDSQDNGESSVVDSDVGQGDRPASTNVEPAPTNDTTPSRWAHVQDATGRERTRNSTKSPDDGNRRSRRRKQSTEITTHDQVATPAAEAIPTQAQRRSLTNDGKLALCLKVDCTKFYQKEKNDVPLLNGKDLKLEVFINGELVEVSFESSRPYKRADVIQFSGTRFHRQAEKPWVYAPAAPCNVNNTPEQRWTNVSNALKQEACNRGTNKWDQRPISAQFLVALARSELPEEVRLKGQQFAVIDLIITSGKGRKFGPDTTYLTRLTRLSDTNFSGLAPVADDSRSFLYREDEPMRDDILELDCDGIAPLSLHLAKGPPEQPHTSLSPQTPQTMRSKNAEKYKTAMDATPMKKFLASYENAHGHVKGKRTLRQRIGDMAKMSPRKRQQTLSGMTEEVGKEAVATIANIFSTNTSKTPTPQTKRVRFNEDVNDAAHEYGDASETQTLAAAADPLNHPLPQMNPSWLENESFGMSPQLRTTTTLEAPSNAGFAGPPTRSSHLPPHDMTFEERLASALSKSLTSAPLAYHHADHNQQAPMQSIDPSVLNEQPVFVPGSPAPRTPSPTARQQPAPGSSRTSKKWLPEEQTSDQALENFDGSNFDGSVTYADGRKQRQVNKARGGEFEEQQFVLGMRFIVL